MCKRSAVAVGVLVVAAVLASCGGGGAVLPEHDGPMGVTMFSPGAVIPSESEQPFLITGWGFGRSGCPCPIRLTATTGTPFLMGTSATLEGAGEVENSECVRGTIEAARILPSVGPVTATIDMVLPDGSTFPLVGQSATFAELEYELRLSLAVPQSGETSGGETVMLHGRGFTRYEPGTPRVWFGPNEATDVVVLNDGVLTCATPRGGSGFTTVRIENDFGDFALGSGFEYFWDCGWDLEFGPADATLSGQDHVSATIDFTDFEFPFFAGTAVDTILDNGRLTMRDATGTALGAIEFVGDCVDAAAPDSHVHVKQLFDRLVVTFSEVRVGHNEARTTCQVILHETGAFVLMWRHNPSWSAEVSLNPTGYTSTIDVDWGLEPAPLSHQMTREIFDQASPFDLEGRGLLFEPNGQGGYQTTLFLLDA